MQLVVFHYHDRPGGVREVIWRGLPMLLERMPGVDRVVLVMGQMTDPGWVAALAVRLGPVAMRVEVRADFGYRSGGEQDMEVESVRVFRSILSEPGTVVWAHNLSVGRNIPLLMALPVWCAAAGARLWMHHHDWWWDGRWGRWEEWRAAGVADLAKALEWSVPAGENVSHFCVNRADVAWVRRQAGGAVRWVGNPLPELSMPDARSFREARSWLRDLTGGREVWVAPVRALRRKNLAEALYLAVGRGGDVAVVTSGGAGAGVEGPAWERLRNEAREKGWFFFPSVMDRTAPDGARFGGSIQALMAAADVVVMPSLQEGFGLPYLEAAALGKPLLAREVPGVAENLSGIGCALRGVYAGLPVAADRFDFAAEKRRCALAWDRVAAGLPEEVRGFSGEGAVGVGGWSDSRAEAVDFGALTLTAQLEVLSGKSDFSGEEMPRPGLVDWSESRKVDQWADRFFASDDGAADGGDARGEGAGGGGGGDAGQGLLEEVGKRFAFWKTHPLLWT